MREFDVSGLLATARRRADVSQRDLAALTGVPPSTIAAAEAGRRSLHVDVLVRLLAAADLRLAVVAPDGVEVQPFDSRAARDNAGRRFPAHLDATHPDVVDPYLRRPRYDRPERRAGFERRTDRDRRRARQGVPDRHVREGEVTLRQLDRRYRRSPAYRDRRPELLRHLGLDDLPPDELALDEGPTHEPPGPRAD